MSSNGGNPVSIAVAHRLVYVANADTDNPNYTGFTLDADGQLRAIPGSTIALPAGSQPGDVLFSRDGKKLVGTRVAHLQIDSFTVDHRGLLTAAPGSPFLHQPGVYGQFGSEFSPTKPNQLFVSNAHTAANGAAPGSVSSYIDAADGTLTPIGASPFPNAGVASCWVEISHDGKFLFTVDTASSSVASYSIATRRDARHAREHAIKNGQGAEDARLSPDGKTLWVVNAGGDSINAFSVKKGNVDRARHLSDRRSRRRDADGNRRHLSKRNGREAGHTTPPHARHGDLGNRKGGYARRCGEATPPTAVGNVTHAVHAACGRPHRRG